MLGSPSMAYSSLPSRIGSPERIVVLHARVILRICSCRTVGDWEWCQKADLPGSKQALATIKLKTLWSRCVNISRIFDEELNKQRRSTAPPFRRDRQGAQQLVNHYPMLTKHRTGAPVFTDGFR